MSSTIIVKMSSLFRAIRPWLFVANLLVEKRDYSAASSSTAGPWSSNKATLGPDYLDKARSFCAERRPFREKRLGAENPMEESEESLRRSLASREKVFGFRNREGHWYPGRD